MKTGLILALALALALCTLTGCGAEPVQLTYTSGELTLQLDRSFVDLGQNEAYDLLCGNGTVTLAAIREDKSRLPALTLQEFGHLVIQAHGLDCQLLQLDGITCFNYEAGDPAFTYTVGVWETENAFWSVQTYCPSEAYAAVRESMWQILQSVTF